jgi:hypothetical protein
MDKIPPAQLECPEIRAIALQQGLSFVSMLIEKSYNNVALND